MESWYRRHAFPNRNTLRSSAKFFAEQSVTGVAVENGVIVGFNIAPQQYRRCGISPSFVRGKKNLPQKNSERLVAIYRKGESSASIYPFQRRVATNTGALNLYKNLVSPNWAL
jgi:hypothetical protein